MGWKYWIGPYYSVRFIRVENWKLALANYFIQFAIFAYIIIYQVILQKHYQIQEHFIGTISTKVKGVAKWIDPQTQQQIVYDIYDAIVPPLEQDAVFIVTNVYSTPQQKRGICPGNDSSEKCDARKRCIPNAFYANGISTGDCDLNSGYCLLRTWCPVENRDTRADSKQLYNIENWSIYIKIVGEFPQFHVQFDNLAPANSTKPLIRYKNLWYVSDILKELNIKYEDIVVNGIIISGKYEFHCNLDDSIEKCDAQWKWTRLDSTDVASTGFNYRYIDTFHDYVNKVYSRTLNKVYGIRILINVVGTASKFDLITLVLTIGSGLGLLGVSKVICDLILIWLMPGAQTVRETKYKPVLTQHRSMSDSDILTLNRMINSRQVDIDDDTFKAAIERPRFTAESEMSRVALRIQPSSSDLNVSSDAEGSLSDTDVSINSPLFQSSSVHTSSDKLLSNSHINSHNFPYTDPLTGSRNQSNKLCVTSLHKIVNNQSNVEYRPSRRSSENRLLS